jgi:hypothetical protein
VSSVTWPGGLPGRDRPASVGRRDFLGLASAAGTAALVAGPTVAPGSLSAGQRALVLQVARAGAVFPIEFPGFGEPGPAVTRATATRLRAAASRLTSERRAQARAGADALIGRGLLGQPTARLLAGIGLQANAATGGPGLTAVVALAIATVSRHFDPGCDEAALVWIDGLRIMHQRGTLALAGGGAR